MPVPDEMRWLFWDADVDAIDIERNADDILARVLERGRLAEVRWALVTYGVERIRRFFEAGGHAEISARTLSFWKAYFETEGKTWRAKASFRTSSSIPWP
jgi:hypothetical protein